MKLQNPCVQAEDLGPVKDGLLISCSTALARRLRAEPPAAVLTALGKRFQFEARPHSHLWQRGPHIPQNRR